MSKSTVPARPLLKPWYRLASESGRTVLEHAHVAVVFEGRATERLLPALLPLLDGVRSVDEVIATLGEPAAPAVANALELLARHGLLTEGLEPGDAAIPAAQMTARLLSATSAHDVAPGDVIESLRRAQVAIVGPGLLSEQIARLLRLSGVEELEHSGLGDPPPRTDLTIVVSDGANLPAVADWNRSALDAGAPWLPVLPFDGRFAAIGPLVIPGETACYECYRLRRASNLEYPEEFWVLEREPRPAADAPALLAALAGLATLVALGWLATRDASLPGMLLALEPAGVPRLSTHHVYRVPRCPACSDAERCALPAPWFDGELLA